MFYQGKRLREGYTTGSCAAAAAKAAVLALLGDAPAQVSVQTGKGPLSIPIARTEREKEYAVCTVIKDSGDDPDVTNGIEVCARVRITQDPCIVIDGGEGVGRVTKEGLKTPVGSAAINPVPLKMIGSEVKSVLPEGMGADVLIFVPRGEEIAAKTFNPRLGIVGGISILGTSGIVRPMSEEAYKESLALELDMLRVHYKSAVFVFGEQGKQLAAVAGIPESRCLVTSNFLGYMLDYAAYRGMEKILLLGQIGKLCKVAAGVFHTHSRVADARMETLAAFAAMEGAGRETVTAIYQCPTTALAVQILDESGLQTVYCRLAERIKERAEQYVREALAVETMVYTDDGRLLAQSKEAQALCAELRL